MPLTVKQIERVRQLRSSMVYDAILGNYKAYKEARKELTRWCEKIKKSANKNIYPLKKVIDTIYEWENQIVNSFIIPDELGGNITNGIVEAKNNVAKH